MTRILYSLCGRDANRPFSPHCWKVSMALAHKGLDFSEKPVAFTEIPKLENGFSKTVPILRDGEHLVRDSFDIAVYLEEAYPDRPTLFGGEGGKALARFVEGFSQMVVHPLLTRLAVKDIHDMLAKPDQDYFRESREARLGRRLEDVAGERSEALAMLSTQLEPMRFALKFNPFLGGETPLFADYILFGALQWARVTTGQALLPADHPVSLWFDRCLDLYDGFGRKVA
ncbi:glutathione S-transferase family protein [Rhizobium sp. SSA_523]|uniref:glutathione S-transferase family protein n=1 Tax=Rhizobium sp. SSA_523 TaxID=2952477 RepID=UPI002090EC10|nr:glutathione S-transferase family protein [Rhizobium sp. SSA_523]MCO5730751.1 glutathione S-transferase family protein [Rhizobium sp. SSA_523]WKC24425.1 glutathione S-transferase family protein [Rhizobium sp. SSA_523]